MTTEQPAVVVKSIPKIDRRKVAKNKNTPRSNIAQRVDTLAAARGISRIDMAKALRVIPVSFNRTMVKGHLPAKHMPLLAELLGTSIHYLVTGLEDQRSFDAMSLVASAQRELDELRGILRTLSSA